jgi:hypothetical protein
MKSSANATTLVLALSGLALMAASPAWAAGKKTYFTGAEENYDQYPEASPGVWYTNGASTFVFGRECIGDENVNEPRLRGVGTFRYTIAADFPPSTGKFWGSAQIVPEIGGGKWTGYFVSTVTPERTVIVTTLAGSGAYSGLIARLTHTSRADGQPGFTIEGYLFEAPGAVADRPFQMEACRTERLEAHPCFLLPFGLPGPEEATVLKAEILGEMGHASHLGLTVNDGFAVVNPLTGAVTGTGIATAANQALIYWVYYGSIAPDGAAEGSVYFCGGTERFDAVVGGFNIDVQVPFEPAGEPGVWEATYSYQGSGTFGY